MINLVQSKYGQQNNTIIIVQPIQLQYQQQNPKSIHIPLIMNTIRKFFKQFDMFSAPATLRARSEAETTSLFAGVISFIVTGLFAYVFIAKVVSTIQYNQISSTQTQTKLLGDQVSANNLMFAIMINYLSPTQYSKYFSIEITHFSPDDGPTTISLSACTSDQWQLLGDNYINIFDQYGLSSFLCPVSNQVLDLEGTFKKSRIKQIKILVKPCSNNGSSTCVNQTLLQTYVNNSISKNRSLIVELYFLDQSVDPTAQNPVTYFVNNDDRVSFTNIRGVDNLVQFGSYQITTDKSLLPWNDYITVTGNFVDKLKNSIFQIDTFGGNPYVVFEILMNRRMIYYSRTIGKLDETLSYVGGLFSIIIGFLAFFILSFNQYRYQLMVAEGSFNYNEDGKRVREKDFHFHDYIKYSIYDWIKTLTCFEPKWEYCQQIDETREQVNCQMDVVRLFRKIRNLETSILYLMSENEKMCLTLFQPPALDQVKRNRMITEYYDVVIGGKPAVTVEDIKLMQNVLQAGLALNQKSNMTNLVDGNSFTNVLEYKTSLDYDKPNDQQQNYIKIAPDRSNILEVVLNNFPHIGKEADMVKLPQQFQEIQMQIARAFFEMDPRARGPIQQKIPLKIIHRLKKKYDLISADLPCKIQLNI